MYFSWSPDWEICLPFLLRKYPISKSFRFWLCRNCFKLRSWGEMRFFIIPVQSDELPLLAQKKGRYLRTSLVKISKFIWLFPPPHPQQPLSSKLVSTIDRQQGQGKHFFYWRIKDEKEEFFFQSHDEIPDDIYWTLKHKENSFHGFLFHLDMMGTNYSSTKWKYSCQNSSLPIKVFPSLHNCLYVFLSFFCLLKTFFLLKMSKL